MLTCLNCRICMQVLAKAQAFAAARGMTLKVVPFEDEVEDVDASRLPAGVLALTPEQLQQLKGRKRLSKVVWVVTRLAPEVDVPKMAASAPRLQVCIARFVNPKPYTFVGFR